MKQFIGALAILITLAACTPAERDKMEAEDKIQTADIAKAREYCSKWVYGDPSWDECMSEQVWLNHKKQ